MPELIVWKTSQKTGVWKASISAHLLVGNKKGLLDDEYTRWELTKVKQEPIKNVEMWQTGLALLSTWTHPKPRWNEGGFRNGQESCSASQMWGERIWMTHLVKPCCKQSPHQLILKCFLLILVCDYWPFKFIYHLLKITDKKSSCYQYLLEASHDY